jgi:uncharacterized membrane protein YfcA
MYAELFPIVASMFAAGAVAGITAGMFGVGGGFVIVPALLAVFALLDASGLAGPEQRYIHLAIGTSLATIVVSSLRSVQAHHRRGAVDFAVLREWAPWLVLGVFGGTYLAASVSGEALLLVFATGVLLYALYFLGFEWFESDPSQRDVPHGVGCAALASGVGGFSALLGIGGGTPFVVTMLLCGRSVHQAVATAAGVGFIIAVPGALGFLIMGLSAGDLPVGSVGFINLPAFVAVSAMSVITVPVGANLAHRLDARHLKRAFGVYLLVISILIFYRAAG